MHLFLYCIWEMMRFGEIWDKHVPWHIFANGNDNDDGKILLSAKSSCMMDRKIGWYNRLKISRNVRNKVDNVSWA